MMKTGDRRPGVCVGIGMEDILAPFAEAFEPFAFGPGALGRITWG